MLSPVWRSRIAAIGGSIVAVWAGMAIAEGSRNIPVLMGVLALGAAVVFLARISLDVLALAALLFGYLVGNRGFAQFMPLQPLPLLPAELGLMIVGASLGLRCAFRQRIPFRRNALNWTVLLFMIAGTVRVVFDVRQYHFAALRDYAMVYYAAFFYLAQEIGRDPRSRQFLIRALFVAALIEPLAAIASETFPTFFYTKLAIQGVPLIFFKGDLAYTFMAVSALLLALAVRPAHRWWVWGIAALEIIFVVGGDNRASILATVVALGWLALSRMRKIVWLQVGAIVVAVGVVGTLALLVQNRWAEQKVVGAAERVRSLGDFVGSGTYVSDESAMKGGNNRFRTLWWHAVIDETFAGNALFGLGFGHDLSRNFLQEYNPEIEDFSARSPHSIAVTVFGRMGFAGLAAFLLFVGAFTRETWRAMRDPEAPAPTLGLWAACWVILISACLGVVLEGPMGAVIFWSLLGLAMAPESQAGAEINAAEHDLEADPRLHVPATAREVIRVS